MAVAAPPQAAAGVPPHNEEAEASVLGAILLTEQALDGVLLEVGLRANDFYRPRHQLIFQAMIRLKEKAAPEAVDALTVSEDLRRSGDLEKAGGEGYLHSLPTVVPAVGAVLDYARIVKEHSLLRSILSATREIQDDVAAHRGEARQMIERAEAVLFKIGHDGGTSEMRSLEAILHDEIDKLEELSKTDVGLTGTPSGFADLDALTGGFQPGNLIVLAARPSMGKSAAATNIAEYAAVEAGVPVALFSLEMSETELAHRFLASQARVSSDDLRKGRVRAEKWPKVLKAVEKLARAPIFVDDSSDMSVLELRAKSRRLAARHGLGLVVVDYLQLMRPEGRPDSSRVEQIGQISRGLKILARELDVPVIAVSQLSRAVESRNPPVPMLSDLRESGCLTGESRIYLPETGEYRPIAELAGSSGFEVVAVNRDTWKLERRKVTRAFSTGRKPVYRLTTQLGRRIRATGNHRFLAFDGWKRLDEVDLGEHLALPTTLPGSQSPLVRSAELALVGAPSAPEAPADRLEAGSHGVGPEGSSDIRWDPVIGIDPDGSEEVFDLTVEGLHNFVAEDIIVHNSIEQDADVVMFIYRDEYYNKESERLGEADMIVAKHRNGPIGEVALTFLPKYPKFANLYRDRGAEPMPPQDAAL
jgi:replicative DNA helicase